MRETVFIGFGSNKGNRLDFCDRAMGLLCLLPQSKLVAVSPLYETEPVLDGAEPGSGWFLNGVVKMETDVTPRNLIDVFREIERSLGRDEDPRHGPRTLDLDLLFYGTRIINEPGCVVPHPRLHQRRFVLVPMTDLDPTWKHPLSGRTVEELLRATTDRSVVRLLDPQPSTRYGAGPACSRSPGS